MFPVSNAVRLRLFRGAPIKTRHRSEQQIITAAAAVAVAHNNTDNASDHFANYLVKKQLLKMLSRTERKTARGEKFERAPKYMSLDCWSQDRLSDGSREK
jgi:hypothetical protein